MQVLRRFGMRPEPGVRLTLIAREPHTPYSGMLPGYVAGQYTWDEIHFDLWKLSVFANCRLIVDEVIGVDQAGSYRSAEISSQTSAMTCCRSIPEENLDWDLRRRN